MSTGSVPQQIIRPIRRGEFMPDYSTDELFRGVCHIAYVPISKRERPVIANTRYLAECGKKGGAATAAASKKRFTDNRDAIYRMLQQTKNKKVIGKMFGIGPDSLKKYLEEDKNAQS